MEHLVVENGFAFGHEEGHDELDDTTFDNQAFIMEMHSKQTQERKRKLSAINMAYDNEIEKEKPDDTTKEDSQEGNKGDKVQRLNEAVISGDYREVTGLLREKNNVNLPDRFGRTPLQNAVIKSDIRIVELLLEAKADVTHKDDRGDTPLQFAARAGEENILKLLLSHSECDVNLEGSGQATALHIAATLNKPNLCKMLLEHGARFDCKDEGSKTPLSKAMENGATKSAQFLLEYVTSKQMDLESYLYNVDSEGSTLLHLAVDSGFPEVVQLCIDKGARIREPKTSDRSTAFHLACEQGASEIVELLADRDPSVAKILLIDSKGSSPLHKAAMSNNLGIVDLLIGKGTAINARNNDNRTALMLAAECGAAETVRLLMERGADSTVRDIDNKTAVSCSVGHAKTMEVLLEDHALVPLLTEKDLSGYAPPHYAALKGDLESIKLFLEHNKSTATVLSDAQDSPLHVAARYGYHDIVRALLEKQGSKIINLKNNQSRTALHFACSGGHQKATATLLEFGATIEKDQVNRTPLHEAARKGSKKNVELIVAKHVQCLNAVDNDKNTALHVATIHGHAQLVTFLLTMKRQEILMNSSNQNILDLAVDEDETDVALAMMEHERWREVLKSCNAGVFKMMHTLIEKMPAVTQKIMDQCIEYEGDETSKDYRIKYDLSIIQCKENPNNPKEKTSLQLLKAIAMNRREKCLTHPVSFIMLSTKWNGFGWIAFMVNIFVTMLYLVPLSYLHVILEDNDEIYCHDRLNGTDSEGNAIKLENVKTCLKTHLDVQILQYISLGIVSCLLLRELIQFISKWRVYITSVTNWIEIAAFICAVLSVIPTCECKWGVQRISASIALFLGWITLILYIQRLPSYGKYVIMLYRMFVTLIKVMLLFLLFAFAFGITFHLLLDQDPFTSLPNALMLMFIMMLGEINYADTFMPWTKLTNPYMTNIMLILFCLLMPIILMNMLVGLSVGDIDKIEQSALIDRYVMQVDLLSIIEDSLPLWLVKRIQHQTHVEYPNRPKSTMKGIFNSVLGFGDAEEDEEEDDKPSPQMNALHEKLEEQTAELEDVRTMIKNMYHMMKEKDEESRKQQHQLIQAKKSKKDVTELGSNINLKVPDITLLNPFGALSPFGGLSPFGSKPDSKPETE